MLTVDLKEPRLLLLVLAELKLVNIVLEAEFLERDGNLVAVGGCSIARLARTRGRACIDLTFSLSSLFSLKTNRLKEREVTLMRGA